MKKSLALPSLAFCLAVWQSGATAQAPAVYQADTAVGPIDYRAVGTEPFWELTIGREIRFTDKGSNLTVIDRTPKVRNGVAGEMYQSARINVNINHMRCSDGMSERTYRDTVQVLTSGRVYRGCGGPAVPVTTVDNRGNPRVVAAQAGPETTLERTRWRVVRINGRPVPKRGDYHVDFDSGRILAKFGCNAISGTYNQTGTTLDSDQMTSTRMACPNMSRELQGQAILDQLMTIKVVGRNALVLTSQAGSLDLARR